MVRLMLSLYSQAPGKNVHCRYSYSTSYGSPSQNTKARVGSKGWGKRERGHALEKKSRCSPHSWMKCPCRKSQGIYRTTSSVNEFSKVVGYMIHKKAQLETKNLRKPHNYSPNEIFRYKY